MQVDMAATSASHYGAGMSSDIATVRIELVDTDPLIWRQVEVPTAMTFKALHDVIQVVMGWTNSHLWEFTIGTQRYGLPQANDGWGDTRATDASKTLLRDVLIPRSTVIDYLYDFGDSWEHRLTVTNVRPGDPEIGYPRYITGELAAPPDDCGGIPGFYHALDVLADPDHEEYADIKEWFGDYDPSVVYELAIKYALGRIANRRRAGRAKAKKPSSH